MNAVALGAEHGTGSASHVAVEAGLTRVLARGVIPMVTLDDHARDTGRARLDFIEMDVEGSEPVVLDGGRAPIKRFAPPILMEFNSWCLTFVQGYNAWEFASCLWDAFEVMSVDKAGLERPAGSGSVSRILHDDEVLHGAVEDVLLRLKPDATVPRQGEVARPLRDHSVRREVEWLYAELDALRRSTSWRVTAPLRALAARMRRFHIAR